MNRGFLCRRQLQGHLDALCKRGYEIDDEDKGYGEHYEREQDEEFLSGRFEIFYLLCHGSVIEDLSPYGHGDRAVIPRLECYAVDGIEVFEMLQRIEEREKGVQVR